MRHHTIRKALLIATFTVSVGGAASAEKPVYVCYNDDGQSEYVRGNQYEFGVSGFPQNYQKALELYQAAAVNKNTMAQFQLGNMYEQGKGVPSDEGEAVKYYLLAARYLPQARFRLGYLCEHGLCVPEDYDLAVKMYQDAAALDFPAAKIRLGLMYEHGTGVAQDTVKGAQLEKEGREEQASGQRFTLVGFGEYKFCSAAVAAGIDDSLSALAGRISVRRGEARR
jgi:TPR repeat protein